MKKPLILLALLLVAASQSAFAQSTILGRVIDAKDGSSIPGASVIVKGTNIGGTTNSSGNFGLMNVPNDAILQVSYIGFKTFEIAVENQTRFDITLQPDVQVLGDVVVTDRRYVPIEKVETPMGIIRDKKTLTTSIQTISGEELIRASDPNFMRALSNNVAGVHVITNGNTTMMRAIRGVKSWSHGGAPLFVIDGVPMARERGDAAVYVDITDVINSIDPNNIESITVLKSANAAMLYGSQAVNGAILITTKKR